MPNPIRFLSFCLFPWKFFPPYPKFKLSLRLQKEGRIIGFVPTMGYLHEGHLSLIDLIRERSDALILSIFVNPTQFGLGEDLEKYPRDWERDLQLCRERKVDYAFAPMRMRFIFPMPALTPRKESVPDCAGRLRPTHFKGVTTICAKLFNPAGPPIWLLGKRMPSRLWCSSGMIRDLHFPSKWSSGPPIREADGLAMKGARLPQRKQRADALLLHRALEAGRRLVDEKECAASIA